VFAKGKKLQRPLIIMVITDGEVRPQPSFTPFLPGPVCVARPTDTVLQIQGERKDTLTSVIFRCMEALKKRNQENGASRQATRLSPATH